MTHDTEHVPTTEEIRAGFVNWVNEYGGEDETELGSQFDRWLLARTALAHDRGYDDGYSSGYAEGHDVGYDDGYEYGYSSAINEGPDQ